MAFYAISVFFLLVSAIVYIYPSICVTNLMYEYSGQLKTLSEVRELNTKMKLEIAALRSYDFIEKRAVEKLGFVFPAPDQVVIIAKR